MTTRIHILRGVGSNCTCGDCVVLYGGKCHTTPTNNMLDAIEKALNQYLNFTPTGKPRKVSDYFIDESVEQILRQPICKREKLTRTQFYQHYYAFTSLVYLMTSDKREARYGYRRARYMLYTTLIRELRDSLTGK